MLRMRCTAWSALVAALAMVACGQRAPLPNEGTPAIPASPGAVNQKQNQRWLARQGQAPQKFGSNLRFAGIDPAKAKFSPLGGAVAPLAAAALTPGAQPDYFASPNWANSPLAVFDPLTSTMTGTRKFVDTLPPFCSPDPANPVTNNLGQCLPIAQKITSGPDFKAGSDSYRIGLVEYRERMHSDLYAAGGLGTKLRGYVDLNVATPAPHYLGPLIIATRDVPVRVRFTNSLKTGADGKLFIPTDTTYMGAGNGPDGTPYTENRATLHLHGGNTPWISDGTPHQWTVPAGEITSQKKGVSARDVPDMASSGDGSLTFFWTNHQSGRLMFYHDHAYGITRLNVYAGEAAGYLLVDPAQETALAAATVPGTITATPDLAHLIPLVIQDKTFVPDDGTQAGSQLAATDPTWDTAKWGTKGDLWFPHVYMPNQNPADVTGANAFGRWDYGPWFWPPQDPSSFVAGGQPSTCTSAAYAVTPPAFPPLVCPGTPLPSGTPEGFMDTPVVNGTAYPAMDIKPSAYRFHILAAGNDRTWNFGVYYAATKDGTICKGGAVADLKTCTEVSMVPAVPHSASATTLPLCSTPTEMGGGGLVTADLTSSLYDPVTGLPFNVDSTGARVPCWPTGWPTDGREGGVPDPSTAGPAIVQIGAEGGLMPAVAAIPSTPVNYEYNRRSITVLNIFQHGLLLGPAERADVVIDFSSVPQGSALILYNDAPTPVPAFDPRTDYYTNGPDNSETGGVPSIPPGFGPNIRTVMQFRVSGANDNVIPFQFAKLLPDPASPGTTGLPAIFAATQDPILVPQKAYPAANGGSAGDNYLRIQDTTITVNGTAHPLLRKTIQELFTLDYGRMNATLGVELQFTNFLTQTTIPYGYVDPPTEIIKDGETQYWKVTHNGVDTHFIHFHLFAVQVINRVGWDGAIKPPDANELGWKDTVRMNPLEDIIVALKPMKQPLPFTIGNSFRPLDVTMAVGSAMPNQFTNVDPANEPVVVTNDVTNFGWEYVWHCHILGHEENDMMRALSFVVPPDLTNPVATAGVGCGNGRCITVTWGSTPTAATAFRLEVSVNSGAFTPLPTLGPNARSFFQGNLKKGNTYVYRLTADNTVGYAKQFAAPAVGYPTVTSSSNALLSNVATITK